MKIRKFCTEKIKVYNNLPNGVLQTVYYNKIKNQFIVRKEQEKYLSLINLIGLAFVSKGFQYLNFF